MGLYNKNIETIRKNNPKLADYLSNCKEKDSTTNIECGIADVVDRKVLYVIKDGEQYQLDSLYENDVFLQRWFSNINIDLYIKTYIIFGLGNGMYVRKILDATRECDVVRIIILEPDETIVNKALEYFDYTDIFSNMNVYLHIDDSSDISLGNIIYKIVDYSSVYGVHWDEYMNYASIFPEKRKELFDKVQSAIDAVFASRTVLERFGKAYYKNTFINYQYICYSKSLRKLHDIVPKNVPSIVVSSGPSLSKNIKLLHEAKGKCFMIATDSALPALMKEDIIPDIYVCIDGRKSSKHFVDERISSIPCVAMPYTATAAVKENQTHFFLAEENVYIGQFMKEQGLTFPRLSSGGSVANTAFSLSVYLGINTIILVGQDLAYTGDKTHAEGTVMANGSIREETLRYTKDIYGNKIKTSSEFDLYRTWFEEQIEGNSELNVIDATEGGAYIDGSCVMTLREAIDKYCVEECDFSRIINECDELFTDSQREKYLRHLRAIKDKLLELKSSAERAFRTYDRMYILAKQGKDQSGEMNRLLKKVGELNGEIDNNPVISYVEYLIQDSVHNVLHDVYKQSNSGRESLIESIKLGLAYTKDAKENTEFMIKDLEEIGFFDLAERMIGG